MSELNQHEQSQNQRIKELEEDLAKLRQEFIDLNESVEDRCMAAVEMLAGAVGGVIASARNKVKTQNMPPQLEMRLVDGGHEVENAETFQVTLMVGGGVLVAQDRARTGRYRQIPANALDNTFVEFLQSHKVPVGQPTLVNLYKLTHG